MAEIKIQEKKRPVWPWIVLLLLVAAVVAWYLLQNRQTGIMDKDSEINDTTETGSLPPDTMETGAQKEVNNFIAFVRLNDTAKMVKTNYVQEGLDHLNSAIKAIIAEKNITGSSAAAYSDSLSNFTSDAEGNEVKQSNKVRAAFISAANIIEDMQDKEQPGMKANTDDLLNKARSIDSRESISEQSEKIKQFFSSAGDILHSMINREV